MDAEGLACVRADPILQLMDRSWRSPSRRGTVRVSSQLPRSGSTVVKGCGRSTLERGSSPKNLGSVKVRDGLAEQMVN